MSSWDLQRLKVLHELEQRHISQAQAAQELGLSVRWVRTLRQRVREHGDGAIVHGLRGRASNRRLEDAVKRRTLTLFREKKQARQWHDYGPTLASEELAAEHGTQVSRETLRQWLIADGQWRPRSAKVERPHLWRARRARWGELVQWDTSEHDWLEGRGEKLYLIAMLDDATSRPLARLARHDSTEENLACNSFLYLEMNFSVSFQPLWIDPLEGCDCGAGTYTSDI
ncbi:MAG: helix-turn-helix domain-containing protein [Acidobacteriales bacterium]|nr:helix-turn-helix domain-containing protein [Terriglobales bacterium]